MIRIARSDVNAYEGKEIVDINGVSYLIFEGVELQIVEEESLDTDMQEKATLRASNRAQTTQNGSI